MWGDARFDELSELQQLQVQLWLEQSLSQIQQHLGLAQPAELLETFADCLRSRLGYSIEMTTNPDDEYRLGDQMGMRVTPLPDLGTWAAAVAQELITRSIDRLQPILRVQTELHSLRQRNQELAQISQLKSEFLANTSHEIRTPLSSILGFTHLLREQGFTPDNLRHQEYLRIILTSGQHLLALINDILDLSKIEANQMDLQWEAIELKSLCKTALMLVKEKANEKGLALKLDIPDACPDLQADPLRLKQMLFNLLSNALKFTEEGQVGLRVEPIAQFLRFTVWDTGKGIPPEQQALLFRAYQQLPQSETTRGEGTGLGLALTQKLAELHGGWIEVQSTVGQGSAFTVVLPYAPATAIVPPANRITQTEVIKADAAPAIVISELETPPPTPIKKFRKATRSYHLLVVEDNPNNARLIITFLCKLGYEVTWAKDSEAMWRSLQQSMPAVILMDVNLPEVDGLTLTRQLREEPRYADIPIIAQTAMAMTGDRETCLAAGVDDYVSKPLDLQKLADVIRKYSEPNATS